MQGVWASLATAGLVICMLLAGCGSGGEELTKAAFIKKAAAICVDAKNQLRAELKDSGDLASSAAGILHTEADEIDSLEGPSNGADQIEAIVGATRKAADTLETKKGLAKAGDPMADADKLAEAYGLKSCPLS